MSDLKKRERFTTSINKDLVSELKQLSAKTKIPMSKLLDEAIEDLIEKRKSAN